MNTDKKTIDRILDRGVIVEVLPQKKEFRELLLSGKKLKIYIGADPTSNALHLSHGKNYMLLEEFRQLGHETIVLIGDFTARIGDPTDKITARKQLSREEVLKNIEDWKKQIRPLMDFDAKKNPPKIVYNHDWLSKLAMEDVINLASNVTVQRMLERDMFEKRLKENQPIFLHEFMYPLMQGYDSVVLDVDVELCGTDQIFNALVGRTLQRKFNNKEKFVVAVNLMENPVTKELMSKSKGTGIFLNVSPFDMYGGIMSQPDEMIRIFLVNNTRLPLDRVDEIAAMDNPRDAKMISAKEIVSIFYGQAAADEAEKKFVQLVQKKAFADNIPEVNIGKNSCSLLDLINKCLDGEMSNSQIRRLIRQNSIRLNGEVKNNFEEIIKIPKDGAQLNVGKKKWYKVFY